MPAFPQKLTWGYSERLPKSAPETAQNSRLMSKLGPFFCKTAQNSREDGKSRTTAAHTAQHSKSGGNAIEIGCLRLEAAWASLCEAAQWKHRRHRSEAESPQASAQT